MKWLRAGHLEWFAVVFLACLAFDANAQVNLDELRSIRDAEVDYVSGVEKVKAKTFQAYQRGIEDAIASNDLDLAIALRVESWKYLLAGPIENPAMSAVLKEYQAATLNLKSQLKSVYEQQIDDSITKRKLDNVVSMRNRLAEIEAAPTDLVPLLEGDTSRLAVTSYISEAPQTLFTDDDVPDELQVTLYPALAKIEGTANVNTKRYEGKVTGHIGKAILFRENKIDGQLRCEQPTRPDSVGYQVIVVLRDNTVQKQAITLEAGELWSWSVRRRGNIIRVKIEREGQQEIEMDVPHRAFGCVGFAATVRRPGDRASLEIGWVYPE